MLLDEDSEEARPDFQATAVFDLPPADKHAAVQAPAPAATPLADFDFHSVAAPAEDFEPTGFADAEGNLSAQAPLEPLYRASQPAVAPVEEMVPEAASPPEPIAPAPLIEIPSQFVDSAPPADAAAVPEETVKVIGSLRISIPLYNVFLNEADEWSRRLQVEISEWALELHRPLPESELNPLHPQT